MTFTITSDHYAPRPPTTVRVRPGRTETWLLDAISSSNGWYDITITTTTDGTWSQRLVGHLETGRPSTTG